MLCCSDPHLHVCLLLLLWCFSQRTKTSASCSRHLNVSRFFYGNKKFNNSKEATLRLSITILARIFIGMSIYILVFTYVHSFVVFAYFCVCLCIDVFVCVFVCVCCSVRSCSLGRRQPETTAGHGVCHHRSVTHIYMYVHVHVSVVYIYTHLPYYSA